LAHQSEQDLKKIFAQSGAVSPSEVGLLLNDKKPGEQSLFEQKADNKKQLADQKNYEPTNDGAGRPRFSKDSKKRKRKIVKPGPYATIIKTLTGAEKAKKAVAELLEPPFLNHAKKKNLRQLSVEQADQFERLKWATLINVPAGVIPDESAVASIVTQK